MPPGYGVDEARRYERFHFQRNDFRIPTAVDVDEADFATVDPLRGVEFVHRKNTACFARRTENPAGPLIGMTNATVTVSGARRSNWDDVGCSASADEASCALLAVIAPANAATSSYTAETITPPRAHLEIICGA